MKSLQEWFDEYGESHQNAVNKQIHYICVPIIYFSVIGLLMSIPGGVFSRWIDYKNPMVDNWAFIAFILVMIFYMKLSWQVAVRIGVFTLLSIIINHYIGQYTNLFIFSLALFSLAWLGQFYGHKIEGKKPSFFKDLQFLLIGPAWVMNHLFKGQ